MKANLINLIAYYCATVLAIASICLLVTFLFRRDLFYADFLISFLPLIFKVLVIVPFLHALSLRGKVSKTNSYHNNGK